MAKLADVAEQAGVSVSTVSRVINRPDMVDPETRSQVEAVLSKMDYRPSRVARRLKNRGKAQILGVIIPDIQNPFYSEIVRGIEDVAYQRDYAVILCNSEEDPEREDFYLNVLHGESADGVILPPLLRAGNSYSADIEEYDFPIVCFDRRLPGDPVDTVIVDNRKGAREVTAHLLGLGHRRIGVICGPDNLSTSTERLEGYQQALRDYGVEIDEELVRMGPPHRGAGHAHSDELLSLDQPPTAIFAANNQLCLGVLECAREHGLSIPNEIAIVGFDDAPWAKLLDPPLTTVEQPTYEIGQQAAQQLLDRLEHPNSPPSLITLDPKLRVRASCGATS
jgi:LacI family transcriptional regulator/LacI family repressor for deo operon, udp, cdd, tsx, nupC, and nupG